MKSTGVTGVSAEPVYGRAWSLSQIYRGHTTNGAVACARTKPATAARSQKEELEPASLAASSQILQLRTHSMCSRLQPQFSRMCSLRLVWSIRNDLTLRLVHHRSAQATWMRPQTAQMQLTRSTLFALSRSSLSCSWAYYHSPHRVRPARSLFPLPRPQLVRLVGTDGPGRGTGMCGPSSLVTSESGRPQIDVVQS